MQNDPVFIASYARTPMGSFQGALAPMTATALGASAVERAGIDPVRIDRISMGCVPPAGLGQAPARQTGIGAGLPRNVEATHGQQGMRIGHVGRDHGGGGACGRHCWRDCRGRDGEHDKRALRPPEAARRRAHEHDRVIDTMMMDGLEDAYEPGKPMGAFAEGPVRDYQFTRAEQDEFALRSLTRAGDAIRSGAFAREIAPVTVRGRRGGMLIDTDEQPGKATPEKIPGLAPASAKEGTITAASAASISDGAAAPVMTQASLTEELGVAVIARAVASAGHAHERAQFATAPVPAIRKVLAQACWSVKDVNLFEVNEAFAVVAMIAERDLGIPVEKLNVNGGATALGHPIGVSGARILATLIAAIQNRGLKRCVAALCIGGGEATAIAVELY